MQLVPWILLVANASTFCSLGKLQYVNTLGIGTHRKMARGGLLGEPTRDVNDVSCVVLSIAYLCRTITHNMMSPVLEHANWMPANSLADFK